MEIEEVTIPKFLFDDMVAYLRDCNNKDVMYVEDATPILYAIDKLVSDKKDKRFWR